VLEERLRNDVFCVEWDVKPYRNQSVCFEVLVCKYVVVMACVLCCVCTKPTDDSDVSEQSISKLLPEFTLTVDRVCNQ